MRGKLEMTVRIPTTIATTLVAASLLLTACGSAGAPQQASAPTPTEAAQEEATAEAARDVESQAEPAQAEAVQALSKEEALRWAAGGSGLVGFEATVAGKVFHVEHDGDAHVYQIYADPKNNEGNTIVYLEGTDPGIANGDYVLATGTTCEDMPYENAFGATMSAPVLAATSVEKSSYQDVVSPALATVEPNLTSTWNGYAVTVQRVEFAGDETRVYVGITNNGAGRLRVYDYNAVIIQDGVQYNTEHNYQADYPSINNEVAVGASISGVMCFPALGQRSLQLQLQGSSDNYEVDGYGMDFVFDITV